MFKSAVDRLGGEIRCSRAIEICQNIHSSAFESAFQLHDLAEDLGCCIADDIDDLGHDAFALY
ncbi:hypothetical protein DD236_10090 [Ancrocorticia populi]|uniref:Uncharacterized protein n=1 Tax=Ancrocorticia populi TaxID=2175228 RepID=A0A2V1K6H1_9ACTO|nr:hypothetical protein DD236_10090 [Ancrocorticia populi]